jgi:hypothetical protein
MALFMGPAFSPAHATILLGCLSCRPIWPWGPARAGERAPTVTPVATRPLRPCWQWGEPERRPGGQRRCEELTMGGGVVGGLPAAAVHAARLGRHGNGGDEADHWWRETMRWSASSVRTSRSLWQWRSAQRAARAGYRRGGDHGEEENGNSSGNSLVRLHAAVRGGEVASSGDRRRHGARPATQLGRLKVCRRWMDSVDYWCKRLLCVRGCGDSLLGWWHARTGRLRISCQRGIQPRCTQTGDPTP